MPLRAGIVIYNVRTPGLGSTPAGFPPAGRRAIPQDATTPAALTQASRTQGRHQAAPADPTGWPRTALVQAMLPHLKRAGWGRVVMITSETVRQPIPEYALSNIVRPGVVGYAKPLVRELGAATRPEARGCRSHRTSAPPATHATVRRTGRRAARPEVTGPT